MIARLFRCQWTALGILALVLSGCSGAIPSATPGAMPTRLHRPTPTQVEPGATDQLQPAASTSRQPVMTRIPTSTPTMHAGATLVPIAGLYESRQEASYLTLEVTHINGQAQVRLLRGQWYASCGHDNYLRLSPWPQTVSITQGAFQYQAFTGQVLGNDQVAITAAIKNAACGTIEIRTIAVLKKSGVPLTP